MYGTYTALVKLAACKDLMACAPEVKAEFTPLATLPAALVACEPTGSSTSAMSTWLGLPKYVARGSRTCCSLLLSSSLDTCPVMHTKARPPRHVPPCPGTRGRASRCVGSRGEEEAALAASLAWRRCNIQRQHSHKTLCMRILLASRCHVLGRCFRWRKRRRV